ncbi:SH3 domain-binding protein 5 [Cichlidogyrus casuarinus]|uniref:SH3 domain-binding protein 5 n=1 Tax=Cichlidogyrus casuarinus TaxID=1844966 RepID=A0ABD2QP41_9PLAT
MEARELLAAKQPSDANTLDLLNLSLIEWNKANLARCKSRELHESYLEQYEKLETRCKVFEHKNRSSVKQAKPFYTCLEDFRVDLHISKDRVESCETRVHACKKLYSSALSNLELISDSLHKRRTSAKNDFCNPRGERTRGVGADAASIISYNSQDEESFLADRNLDPPAGAEYSTTVTEVHNNTCSQNNTRLLREIKCVSLQSLYSASDCRVA